MSDVEPEGGILPTQKKTTRRGARSNFQSPKNYAIDRHQINLFGLIKKEKTDLNRAAAEIVRKQRDLAKLELGAFLEKRQPVKWSAGYTMVPNEIITAPDLKDGEKMALINLLRYRFGKKRAFPSIERQADDLGISSRQLQRRLTRLVARAYIWISLVKSKGQRYFNAYQFNLEDISKPPEQQR